MKSCFLILVALALTTGKVQKKSQLTVYGLADVNNFNFVNELYPQVFGFKSINPFTYPVAASTHYPHATPVVPAFRNDFSEFINHPFKLRDLFHKPIIVVTKNKEKAGESLDTFLLEHGLSQLTENPDTRFIHEKIKSGFEKSAVIIHPNEFYWTPAFKVFKNMPVSKFEIPTEFKFANLARALNKNIPYVFIHDKEDMHVYDSERLNVLGSLDVTEDKLEGPTCY